MKPVFREVRARGSDLLRLNDRLLVILSLSILLPGCGESKRTRAGNSKQHTSNSRALSDESGKQADPSNNTVAVARGDHAGSHDARYDITLAQIREHQKAHTAVLIDARGPDEFARRHLQGAINLPASAMETHISRVHEEVLSGQLIIIYCSNTFCDAANSVCEYLRAQGYTNLRVYRPGWAVLSLAKLDRTSG
jgi:rhodanese-related sulfurtransferase